MLTAATLNALLGGSVTDWQTGGPDATRALFWEAGAVADAETWTARTYRAADTLTEFYNGSEDQRLELRQPVASGVPVVSIGYGTSSWTDVAADRVTVRKHPQLGIDNVLHLANGRWPYGEGNIRVVYDGGYEEGEDEGDIAAPGDIRTLVARLTLLRFTNSPVATSATSNPDTDTSLPDDLKAIVQRWRWSEALVAYRLLRAC